MGSTAPPVKDGDIIGAKYRVEQLIGTGGMGHVVSAVHVHLEQRVAIKVMRTEHLDNVDAVKRFEREARAACKLKSAHTARVMDVGTLANGAPYMVMEMLEGATLRALLRQRGRLECDEAASLIAQACDAIAEAHKNGLVHRDVKPSNLFVTRTSTGKHFIKVLDFGIVKAIESDAESGTHESTLTKTQTAIGSPRYMAPEQVTSSKTVDRRADVWSLGAVLFEMVTGEPPFRADNLLELGAKIVHEPAPEIRAMRPDVPPELDHIIHRCLQKKAENRYADAAELSAALEGYLHRAATSDPQVVQGSSTQPFPQGAPISAPASSPRIPTPTGPFAPPTPPSSQSGLRAEDTGSSHGTGIAWGEAPPRSGSRTRMAIVLGVFGVAAVIGIVLVGVAVTRGSGSAATASSAAAASAVPPPSVASETPADQPSTLASATASAHPPAAASSTKIAVAPPSHSPPPPTTTTQAARTNTSQPAARPSPAQTTRPAPTNRAFDHL